MTRISSGGRASSGRSGISCDGIGTPSLDLGGHTIIFRLSQKLAQKIKVVPKVRAPLDANPFADWSAHLFTAQRTRYIILTNTASLYSVIMYGKGISDDEDFIDSALTHMREFLPADGNEFIFRKFIAPASGEVAFSKAFNRGVTGSMNDMISCATFQLVQREMSPFEAASSVNEMPMSYLEHKHPREAFKALHVLPLEPCNETPS